LAANQGLYNGFLAAGLIWSLLIPNPIWSQNVATFFLACVAIAGIYGSITAAKSIFFVQALPAIIGLIIVLMSNN
jgi:putative membrane protein